MVYHPAQDVKGKLAPISGERKDVRPRHRDRALFDRMFRVHRSSGETATYRDLTFPRPDDEERRRPTAGEGRRGHERGGTNHAHR